MTFEIEYVGRKNDRYPVGFKCDIEAYYILLKCSKNKDSTEWNLWRNANKKDEIYLQGAELRDFNLKEADFRYVHCEQAKFFAAHCEKADFYFAHCEGAIFRGAHCEGANFDSTHCDGADFIGSFCIQACFENALCEKTKFEGAHCERARFIGTYCREGSFTAAYLGDTIFYQADITGTDFFFVKLTQETLIGECAVSDETMFINCSLSSVTIDPGTRAKLEQNARRHAWEEWYPDQNFFLRLFTKWFWYLSNYGYSTIRILKWFFLFILMFSLFYTIFPEMLNTNSFVSNEPLYGRFFRMLAFATSTMVTLGFSNINVNVAATPMSYMGTLVVTLNLLVGYFMLAVLVTRLAVLFQTLGPGLVVPKDKPPQSCPPPISQKGE